MAPDLITNELLEKVLDKLNEISEKLNTPKAEAAQLTEFKQPLAQFVVGVGDIWQLLNAPAEGFSPEFRHELEQFAITHFKARQKTVRDDQQNSGNYKKPAAEA